MINGGICTYSGGNQLAQAAAFLASHKGKVQLVTIDIGANDLNPCVVLPTINQIVACLEQVFPQVQANLTTIMNTLSTASGSGRRRSSACPTTIPRPPGPSPPPPTGR